MPPSPLLSIVIPTYDEEANIKPLLAEIRAALDHRVPYEVVFIDDSSDKTEEVIEREIQDAPNFHIVHRAKNERTGLATAVLEGFKKARGEYICCIDADLQHPPKKIFDLLAAIQETGADLAVASRYIEGGSAEGLGSWYRKSVSLLSKRLVHALFPSTQQTSDPCSGFFMFRKSLYNRATIGSLRPRGYKILLELLIRLEPTNICDVPYALRARKSEMSKASFKEGIAFMNHLWRLWRAPGTTSSGGWPKRMANVWPEVPNRT